VYAGILLVTRQVSLDEVRALGRRFRAAREPGPAYRGILDAAGGPPGPGWGAG
jgi:hypothetical protein